MNISSRTLLFTSALVTTTVLAGAGSALAVPIASFIEFADGTTPMRVILTGFSSVTELELHAESARYVAELNGVTTTTAAGGDVFMLEPGTRTISDILSIFISAIVDSNGTNTGNTSVSFRFNSDPGSPFGGPGDVGFQLPTGCHGVEETGALQEVTNDVVFVLPGSCRSEPIPHGILLFVQSDVPEPSALWLVASGMIALVLIRRGTFWSGDHARRRGRKAP